MDLSHLSLKQKGIWIGNGASPDAGSEAFAKALADVNRPVALVNSGDRVCVAGDGTAVIGNPAEGTKNGLPLLAYTPALIPSDLGDPAFLQAHGLRYAYVMGAMANGITSAEMVIEAARNGMLGVFGAGGLTVDKIETAIDTIQHAIGTMPYGFNLIHSPGDLQLETDTVNLYLKKNVRLISAAAYMRLTEPLVLFRVKGIHRDSSGSVIAPNSVIGKVSRIEVARQFFSPPPKKMIDSLLSKNLITAEEAELSQLIPVSQDLSAEADSGGHTDNRPALALLPTMIALRDEMMTTHNYQEPLRVGLGGGIATPESAAAAFSMGAAYILTGSVNQSCIESGTSGTVKELLSKAEQADVIMAPAADMFEMGVKVQVLKRGTMFALKAGKLYDYYRAYDSIEAMPQKIIDELESRYFQTSVEAEWQSTKSFFEIRDPRQLERAEKDPKHKMALLFRSYLGRASMWAVTGEKTRTIDYQVWCGPAMGAFNEWVKGTFLEKAENRKVATVAMNLLLGACVVIRASQLRQQGITLPPAAGKFAPLTPETIKQIVPE